ncbi:MAG: hypothetical protein DRN20_04345, partial [Thermoplasmata archaeon]
QNHTSSVVFTGYSNATGVIAFVPVDRYMLTAPDVRDYSCQNHSIIASKYGYETAVVDFNASMATDIVVFMHTIGKPEIPYFNVSRNLMGVNSPIWINATVVEATLLSMLSGFAIYNNTNASGDFYRIILARYQAESQGNDTYYVNTTWDSTDEYGYISEGDHGEYVMFTDELMGRPGIDCLFWDGSQWMNGTLYFSFNGDPYAVYIKSTDTFLCLFTPEMKIRPLNMMLLTSGGSVTTTPGATYNILNITLTKYSMLEDGDYLALVSVCDRGFLQNATFVPVTVDNTPPTIESITPPDNTWFGPGEYTITVTATGASKVVFYASSNGTWEQVWVDSTPGDGFTLSINTTDSNGPPEGLVNLTVAAYDDANNIETEIYHFGVDTTPPVITVFSPANNTLVNGSFVLRFSVTKELFADVQVAVDSVVVYHAEYYNESPVVELEIDTTNLSDGWHEIQIFVRDIANNRHSVVINFELDTTPPVISSVSPVSGVWWSSGSHMITVNASDVNLYNATLSVLVESQWSIFGWDNDTSDGITFWVNVSTEDGGSLGEGSHLFKIVVNDRAGNSNSTLLWVNIDTKAPKVELVGELPVYVYPGDDLSLTINIGDVSYEVYVTIMLDADITLYTDSVSCWGLVTENFVVHVPENVNDGVHTLIITVRDAAGNEAYVTENTTIDTTPPVISGISPVSGVWLSYGSHLITVNASDVNIYNATFSVLMDGQWSIVGWDNDTSDGITFWINISADGKNSIGEGSHMFRVVVNDCAGNSNSTMLEINVDLTPPEVEMAALPYYVYPGDDINLSMNITDASGEVNIVVMLDNSTILYSDTVFFDGWTMKETTVHMPENLNDGSHTLNIITRDRVGNEGYITKNIMVDTVPPEINIHYPSIVYADTEVVLNASNTTDACASLSFSWYISGPETFNLNGSRVTFTPLLGGEYNVTLSVSDAAGNTNTTTFTILVQFEICIGPLLYEDGNPVENATITVDSQEYATDANGNISLYLNSGTYDCSITYGNWYDSFTLIVEDNGSTRYTLRKVPLPLMTLTIGPVHDTNGNPISDANVTVIIDGKQYNGTTDENGYVRIEVPPSAIGKNARIIIEHPDYETIDTNATVPNDGVIPLTTEMKPQPKEKGTPVIVIMALVLIILAIGVFFIAIRGIERRGGKFGEESIEEAEEFEENIEGKTV